MTHRDRAADDVGALVREAQVLHELHRHGGERLVDLQQVDVVDRHAGLGEHLVAGGRGAGEHDRRGGAGGGGGGGAGARGGGGGPARPLAGGQHEGGGGGEGRGGGP